MLASNHKAPWLCPLRASNHQPSLLFQSWATTITSILAPNAGQQPRSTVAVSIVGQQPPTSMAVSTPGQQELLPWPYHCWPATTNHQPPCYLNCGPATTNQQMPANRNYFHGCIQCGPTTTHHHDCFPCWPAANQFHGCMNFGHATPRHYACLHAWSKIIHPHSLCSLRN